jgi:hypothetical protein
VDAVGSLGEIDPADGRRHVEERYDVPVIARAYEQAYRKVHAAVGAPTGAGEPAVSI